MTGGKMDSMGIEHLYAAFSVGMVVGGAIILYIVERRLARRY